MFTDNLEYMNCPLCNCEKNEIALSSKDYIYSQREFSIVRCKYCGLLYTNPRIIKNNIVDYYYPEYPAYKEAKKWPKPLHNIKIKIRDFLGNPTQQLLQVLKSRNVKKVLEIGPGLGNLLVLLKENGFEVCGVEINKNSCQQIRKKGIRCYLGEIDDIVDEIITEKFDAIILCNVFEHIYYPNKTLKTIRKLLVNNGIIYLSLPNIDSIEAKLFGKYWSGFDLPRHVVHYNSHTIQQVLISNGFNIIELKDEVFPSSFLESMGIYFFKNHVMPKQLYYILYYLWRLLYPVIIKFIGSGFIKVIATKNSDHASHPK